MVWIWSGILSVAFSFFFFFASMLISCSPAESGFVHSSRGFIFMWLRSVHQLLPSWKHYFLYDMSLVYMLYEHQEGAQPLVIVFNSLWAFISLPVCTLHHRVWKTEIQLIESSLIHLWKAPPSELSHKRVCVSELLCVNITSAQNVNIVRYVCGRQQIWYWESPCKQ